MKRTILCIALALLLLIGALPTAAFAAQADTAAVGEDIVLSDINIAGGAAPAAGENPSYSFGVHTFDSKVFEVASVTWYNLTDGTTMGTKSTFADTKTYSLCLRLRALDGYVFDEADNIGVNFLTYGISPTRRVAYNYDAACKDVRIYFTFRMSGDTDSCIIQFLPNGGTGFMKPVVTEKGKAYTLPSCSLTAPEGGWFKSWSHGDPGDIYNVSSDTNIKAEWDSALIKTVGVTGIASPRFPNTCDFTASAVGSGFEINTEYDDGENVVNGIEWWAVTGSGNRQYKINYGIAQNEYNFMVVIHLKAKTLRRFDDVSNMTGTVNGRTAEVRKDRNATNDSKYVDLVLTYGVISEEVRAFVTAPAAYTSPSFSASFVGRDAQLNTSRNAGGYVGGVLWQDVNTGRVLTESDYFAPGHTYSVTVAALPYNSSTREFPVEYDGKISLYSATVNGEKATSIDDFTASGVRAEDECIITYTFPAVEDNSTVLTQAEATVTAPAAGEHPVATGTVPEKGYKVKSVVWLDSTNGSYLSSSSTFVEGGEYTAKVYMQADDGCVFKYNGGVPDVYGTVNGNPASVTNGEDIREIVMYYEFPAIEKNVTQISSVIVTGIVAPEPGKTPGYTASVSGQGYSVEDFNVQPYRNGVAWFRADGSAMQAGEAFETGREYTVTVSLVATDSYEFASSVSATVNGKTADAQAYSPSTAAENIGVSYTFTCGGSSYLIGDVDGNGKVNNRDAMLLDRYIADWDGYAAMISRMDAADLDRNGKVNNRDAVVLDRYVAGWEGYDIYIIEMDP